MSYLGGTQGSEDQIINALQLQATIVASQLQIMGLEMRLTTIQRS